MYRNSEGYKDLTAGQAIANVTRQHKEKLLKEDEERKSKLINVVKMLIELNDFELVNRIHVKSKTTGKEYK